MPNEEESLRQAERVSMVDVDVLAYTARSSRIATKNPMASRGELDLSPRCYSLRDVRSTFNKLKDLTPKRKPTTR